MTSSCNLTAQKQEINVECFEIEEDNPEYSDITIIKNCKFKNHLFQSIGTPDYKGRYSYKFHLFKLEKNDTLKINNSHFFNSNEAQLEKLLNEKSKVQYESDLKHPEIGDCMKAINFRKYKLDEFGISFVEKNKMEFSIDFGVGSACFVVNTAYITLEIPEVRKYLK